MQKYNFYNQTLKLIKAIVFGLIIFAIFRFIFVFRFGNLTTFTDNISDMPLALWRGFISDMQVVCYLLILVYVINFLSIIPSDKVRIFANKFSVIYIPIAFTIAIITTLVNHEYYSFFKLNFNPVLFDFFDESPLLLMQSMWQEHPVILILLCMGLLAWGVVIVIKRIYLNKKYVINAPNSLVQIILGLAITFLFFVSMRGSLGTFPLQKEMLIVSDNEFINICVPNPLYSLKDAYISVRDQFNFEDPNKVAENRGFSSIEEAVSVYYDVDIDSVKQNTIDHYIFQKSFLKKDTTQYNIVYVVMESMSNILLDFHSKDNNLLGALEKHFNEDVVFRNFQSYENGTLASLEHIVACLSYSYVFDSKYRYNNFGLSLAKPFKRAGYKTNFTTGVSLGWRHIGEALVNQDFDEVHGQRAILKHYPQATSNKAWGVYDHCVFDYIYQQLINNKSDSSMFLLSLSSTNHTPYQLPSDYKPYPINTDLYKDDNISLDKETCADVLTAYQYSNDAIGKFLDKIKNSELAKNTIVIVTGDHNNRSIFNFNTQSMQTFKYSVPLYLYLPNSLKDSLCIDTKRWGSHCDIMTSIYPYVLYNVEYPCLGQNLFDKNKPNNEYYSINIRQNLYSETANKERIERKIKAREAIILYYYGKQFQSLN